MSTSSSSLPLVPCYMVSEIQKFLGNLCLEIPLSSPPRLSSRGLGKRAYQEMEGNLPWCCGKEESVRR